MNVIHPAVHPVEAPPVTDAANDAIPRGRMKDIPGMPGTPGSLALRFSQFAFALLALCVMATTSDFPTVTAFWYQPPAFFSFISCCFVVFTAFWYQPPSFFSFVSCCFVVFIYDDVISEIKKLVLKIYGILCLQLRTGSPWELVVCCVHSY